MIGLTDLPIVVDGRIVLAATLLTLAAGVIALYVLLLVVALASAALVIEGGVFASTLGHPVGVGDYLGLVVFATAIGAATRLRRTLAEATNSDVCPGA